MKTLPRFVLPKLWQNLALSRTLIKLWASMLKKHQYLKLIGIWPPFLGAGIKLTHITPDLREIRVEMKLRWFNSNYVGTHFGGSLYAMTDPFYMIMLIENLGRDYIVWDKSAQIQYKRPGRGKVSADFKLTQEQINQIRADADSAPKVEPVFEIPVLDEAGEVVALVQRTIYVRRKDRVR